MRLFIVGLLMLIPLSAEAGRCNRQSYHSIHSSKYWQKSCYSCHEVKESDKASWRDGVLAIAKAQQEYAAMNQALSQLGFNADIQQAGVNTVNYEAAANQGNTVYGYSAFSSNYGSVDLASLYNNASRLATQAQELAGQANVDFQALVQQEGNNQAEVAKILAQGQAAAQVLSQIKPEPIKNNVRVFQFSAKVGPEGVEIVPDEEENTSEQVTVFGSEIVGTPLGNLALTGLFENKCVQCHSGENPKGNLDLNKWLGFSAEEQAQLSQKIQTRILLPKDDEKHMPPSKEGVIQLSTEELGQMIRLLPMN